MLEDQLTSKEPTDITELAETILRFFELLILFIIVVNRNVKESIESRFAFPRTDLILILNKTRLINSIVCIILL